MTGFAFRLEKVLHWRRARLELEQFALSRLAAECARWDDVLAKISLAETQAGSSIRASRTVYGADLQAFSRHVRNLAQQRTAALERRRECHERMEQQRKNLLMARREFRLLEKLRQARRAEWEIAINRQFDALTTEIYLAQWKPKGR